MPIVYNPDLVLSAPRIYLTGRYVDISKGQRGAARGRTIKITREVTQIGKIFIIPSNNSEMTSTKTGICNRCHHSF